jgi:hypothetical protein
MRFGLSVLNYMVTSNHVHPLIKDVNDQLKISPLWTFKIPLCFLFPEYRYDRRVQFTCDNRFWSFLGCVFSDALDYDPAIPLKIVLLG